MAASLRRNKQHKKVPRRGVEQAGLDPHHGSDDQREGTCPRSHGTLASVKGFPAWHLPPHSCHNTKNVHRIQKLYLWPLVFCFVLFLSLFLFL